MVRKRRDRLYIIDEILNEARDGALKTQIMYRCNLSFSQLNAYLDLLTETELLGSWKREDDGKEGYKTTKRGNEYRQSYKGVIETLSKPNEEVQARIRQPSTPKQTY